jgi:hypothetical protein
MQANAPVKRKHSHKSTPRLPKHWPVNVRYVDGIIFDLNDGMTCVLLSPLASDTINTAVYVLSSHVEIRFLPLGHPGTEAQ